MSTEERAENILSLEEIDAALERILEHPDVDECKNFTSSDKNKYCFLIKFIVPKYARKVSYDNIVGRGTTPILAIVDAIGKFNMITKFSPRPRIEGI